MTGRFWSERPELLMDGSAGNLPGQIGTWRSGPGGGWGSDGRGLLRRNLRDCWLLNGSQGFSRRGGRNVGRSAANTDTVDAPGQTRKGHGNGCRAGCVNMASVREEVDPTHPDQQMVVDPGGLTSPDRSRNQNLPP